MMEMIREIAKDFGADMLTTVMSNSAAMMGSSAIIAYISDSTSHIKNFYNVWTEVLFVTLKMITVFC